MVAREGITGSAPSMSSSSDAISEVSSASTDMEESRSKLCCNQLGRHLVLRDPCSMLFRLTPINFLTRPMRGSVAILYRYFQ